MVDRPVLSSCARYAPLCNHRRYGSTSRDSESFAAASFRRKISNLHVFTFDVSIAPVRGSFSSYRDAN
jgi:hypothetical protein